MVIKMFSVTKQNKLTAESLKEMLSYNKNTGLFTWKIKPSQRSNVGDIAGCSFKGYIYIKIKGQLYAAHRLAWLYVHGVWPSKRLDHKDTVKDHNWIKNLREVTNSENMQNQTKAQHNSKTGLLGVTFHKNTGKYQAQITINGKIKYLGLFITGKLAYNAYLKEKRKLHTTCTL